MRGAVDKAKGNEKAEADARASADAEARAKAQSEEDASKRAQADPATFQSTIPSKPCRHCPTKPAAAAVSEGQPENSTETHGPYQFSEYPIRSQSYPRGRLCGASDPFRPGSAEPQEGFGELENLPRPPKT